MKQFVKIGVLSVVVAVVLFGVYHHLRAQGEGPKSIVAACGRSNQSNRYPWHPPYPAGDLCQSVAGWCFWDRNGDRFPTGGQANQHHMPGAHRMHA
jgi:hypothetical protein